MPRPTRLGLLRLEDRATPAAFTVTTVADTGPGSLRQAILDANVATGRDNIAFDIPGGGVHTIQLASQLPQLQGPVAVDGYSQPGSSPNTLNVGDNAVIRVEVLGGGGAVWGFVQQAGFDIGNSSFRGLALGNFSNAAIYVGTANNVAIAGNFIGLRPDGVTARANGSGVFIEGGGSGHTIGSIDPADRNVISGNLGNGVEFYSAGVSVLNNYVGTTASGTARLGNAAAGVTFLSSNNIIGGTGAGMGNVISGNGTHGIWARVSSGTTVAGNRIGTDATGTVALGNAGDGISFSDAGSFNLIGGTSPGSRNLTSGNGRDGIFIEQGGVNAIQGNYVGTDAAGTAALPNGQFGIVSSGPASVGGPATDSGNLVSGNAAGGMVLRGLFTAGYNQVGTDVSGANSLPNGGPGVLVDQLGGTLGGAAGPNTIAFNAGAGVAVQFPANHLRVNGNSIYANAGPGIDLIGDANDGVRPPTLTAAPVVGTTATYTGTTAGTTGDYRIEFFASPAGGEEGQVYLGFTTVTVTAAGPAAFAAPLGVPPAGLGSITATATRGATGSTSEFSAPISLGTVPNTPPTISAVADLSVPLGGTSAPISFQVSDAESPADALVVTAVSSLGSVVPPAGIVLGGSGSVRTVKITPATIIGKATASTITLTVTDSGGLTATDTFVVTVTTVPPPPPSPPPPPPPAPPPPPPPPPPPVTVRPVALVGVPQFSVGVDVGGSGARLYNPDTSVRFAADPFPGFTGGVRTAAADFNGDGIADLVAGTGPGSATRVRILDGVDKHELFAVDPFEASFTGGVYVTAGDLNGDGVPDLVISPDEGGGPRVDVYSGKGFGKLASFFGIDDPNFRGGARASTGDISGDGRADLIVVAGFGGGPRVAGFDGTSIGGTPAHLFGDFFAFEQALRNGIFVTAGDVDGDGNADLICGGGPGGGPRVTVFSGKSLLSNNYEVKANFFGGDDASRGGIRVAAKDLDGDAKADIVVGAGSGAGSRVTAYFGKTVPPAGTPPEAFAFDAYIGFTGGVFVG